MRIQDVYTIGVLLHQRLKNNRIDYVRTNKDFVRIWEKSRDEVQELVNSGAIALQDNSADIDWNLFWSEDRPADLFKDDDNLG